METPRYAESPFDPASQTPDVILRSSDNVDFCVIKTFLAFSSPDVFAPMFTLPQAQHDIPSPSGLHIVPVAEDSKPLRILLLCCYPLDLQDEANDIEDIARAVSAARKYAMDFAEKRIEKILLPNALPVLDKNPLHVYAVACRYGLEELGRAAVRKTLEVPPSHLSPSPELKHITGMDMYQLTQCRHRCVQGIWRWYFLTRHCFLEVTPYGELETPYVWFDERSHDKHTPGEPCSFVRTEVVRVDDWDYLNFPMDYDDDHYTVLATTWWSTYFLALMKAIELCPSKRTVVKVSEEACYRALKAASSCTFCRLEAARHLDFFREDFAKNIDEIVTQVKGEGSLFAGNCSSISA